MVGCGEIINLNPSTRCGDISFSNKIILCKGCEKRERNSIFINHIKDHLKDGEVVICKVCNKSADEIISDAIVGIDETEEGQ